MFFDFARGPLVGCRVVILGIPLDRTSSFIPGTRFGPDAARAGSVNIESFSPYLRRDAAELPIHDAGNLELSYDSPTRHLELIASTARDNHAAGRRQLAIGGEHTITPAIVQALARAYPDLCVIHFDAHSDLRDTFHGEKWCHATAMRRVLDLVPRDRLFQLGIRSFSREEEMTAANVYPFEVLAPVKEVAKAVGSRPAYVTLDVDVLDPGVMPEVQTPQPGGCSFRDLAESLAALSKLDVVGADLVEFCPRSAFPSTFSPLVAELARELALTLARG